MVTMPAVSIGFRTTPSHASYHEPVQPSADQRQLAWRLASDLLERLSGVADRITAIACEFIADAPGVARGPDTLVLVVTVSAAATPWHPVEVKRHREIHDLEQFASRPEHWKQFVVDATVDELADRFNAARAHLRSEYERSEARQDLIGRPNLIDLM